MYYHLEFGEDLMITKQEGITEIRKLRHFLSVKVPHWESNKIESKRITQSQLQRYQLLQYQIWC